MCVRSGRFCVKSVGVTGVNQGFSQTRCLLFFTLLHVIILMPASTMFTNYLRETFKNDLQIVVASYGVTRMI